LYSASSGGRTDNPSKNPKDWEKGLYPLKMSSIFESLEKDDYSWSVHFMDWNDALFVSSVLKYPSHNILD